jgi:hypothetical protein
MGNVAPQPKFSLMAYKPDIPKAYASRVRASFGRVTSAREKLVHCRFRLKEQNKRVDAFEADPEGFSSKHYPRMSVDSHPVQTTIRRAREDIARYHLSIKQGLADLKRAELEATAITLEAVGAARTMRPTSGRVPFPSEPATEEELEADYIRRHNVALDESLEQARQTKSDLDAQTRADEEKHRRDDAVFQQEVRTRRAMLSAVEREREDRAMTDIRAALKSGELTVWDVIAQASNRVPTKETG